MEEEYASDDGEIIRFCDHSQWLVQRMYVMHLGLAWVGEPMHTLDIGYRQQGWVRYSLFKFRSRRSQKWKNCDCKIITWLWSLTWACIYLVSLEESLRKHCFFYLPEAIVRIYLKKNYSRAHHRLLFVMYNDRPSFNNSITPFIAIVKGKRSLS